MSIFNEIYEIVKQIPKGKVLTYGEIARIIGHGHDSRIVGWALNKNPDSSKIPCHRVVNKEGKISKSFAFGGENMQRKLLENEGVEFVDENKVNLKKHLWNNYQKKE